MKAALLFIILFFVFCAQARESAPPFAATTLGGETFTSESVKGKVTLVEFWATWCSYCRRDEPAVENITHKFAGEGLVVLAVNVGESGQTVKKYLAARPRTCNVVLTEDTNLVTQLGFAGLPFYVVINRDGDIAGMQEGAGGESALRGLLIRAGLGGSLPDATRANEQDSPAPKTKYPSSAKLIEAPLGPDAPPSKPLPPTVFILKTGEKLEANHYTITAGSVHIGEHGNERDIALAALDTKATIAANHERGIEVKIPTQRNEIFLGF